MDLKQYKHAHFVGIGGIGVSALAEIAKKLGLEVSGSDMKASPITDSLQEKGIKVYIGHAAENAKGADLVVYSNAVNQENPELVEGRNSGATVVPRAVALGAIMDSYPYAVAVSGTHGKTTTTSMVSLILKDAGLDPTILVGGILNELGSNVAIGSSDYFVTEACEYMDSFLSLTPNVEIILNIDSDHLDYFKNIGNIEKSFRKFAESVPENGFIVAFDANPFVKTATENVRCKVVRFGYNENSDFYPKNIVFDDLGHPSYDLYSRGEMLGRIALNVPGEHNVANSLAAIATCANLGVDLEVMKATLAKFSGTQRRFDMVGTTKDGVRIVDDYAHHPTEVKATLAAAQKLAHKDIWCLFQPHTYTRTMALMDDFADAFGDADHIVLAEIYAAREKNIYKLSSEALAQRIKELHPEKDVRFIGTFDEIADFVYKNAQAKDVVITMGAGDIYHVGEMILEKDKQ